MLSWRGCRNVLKGRQAENVTSGSVDMGAYTPIPNVFTHFSGANLIGGFQPATWDIQVVQTGPAPGAVIARDFNGLGLWGNMYTTASPPTPLGSAPVALCANRRRRVRGRVNSMLFVYIRLFYQF